jgi:hypothetical protein
VRKAPEDRVRDVTELVRVERDVNVTEFVFETSDHFRQALHVVLRAGDVQGAAFWITKVDLRVDNQQFNSLAHL